MNKSAFNKIFMCLGMGILFSLLLSSQVYAANPTFISKSMKQLNVVTNSNTQIRLGDTLTTEDGFEYEVNGDGTTVTIKKYTGTATEVTVPAQIGTYNVTKIGRSAFREKSKITKIVISEGIGSIEDYAFHFCSSLDNITIPSSVTTIGDEIFLNCKSLREIILSEGNQNFTLVDGVLFNKEQTRLIRYPAKKEGTQYNIPNTVTEIGGAAFNYCEKLANINIPASVTSIGRNAFSFCKEIKELNIPNGVTSLEGYVFYSCSQLTGMNIPESVTSIEMHSFYGCKLITELYIPKNVSKIDADAFSLTGIKKIDVDKDNQYFCSVDGVVYNKDKTKIIRCPEKKEAAEYNILDTVTEINDNAFLYCNGINKITVPNSVTKIGTRAFASCSNLTSINIPEEITSIPTYMLMGCRSLRNITIPSKVTTIGYNSFGNCKSLTGIVIPNSVTKIGEKAFENSEKLKNIIIKNNEVEIKNNAFKGCEKLTIICASNSTSAQYAEGNEIKHEEVLRGDINEDARVTITDLLSFKRRLVGIDKFQDIDQRLFDMNKDGQITTTDLLLMKQTIVGLI